MLDAQSSDGATLSPNTLIVIATGSSLKRKRSFFSLSRISVRCWTKYRRYRVAQFEKHFLKLHLVCFLQPRKRLVPTYMCTPNSRCMSCTDPSIHLPSYLSQMFRVFICPMPCLVWADDQVPFFSRTTCGQSYKRYLTIDYSDSS